MKPKKIRNNNIPINTPNISSSHSCGALTYYLKVLWWAYQELNPNLRLRRPKCYPLHHMPVYLFVIATTILSFPIDDSKGEETKKKHLPPTIFVNLLAVLSGVEPESRV